MWSANAHNNNKRIMKGNNMLKTVVSYTQQSEFTAADFEDLGEVGVINESLKWLFEDSLYVDSNDVMHDVRRFLSVESKIVPERNKVVVYLYGDAELA